MKLGVNQMGVRVREHYDKIIAFVVLLLLLTSLVYLGVKVVLIRQMQAHFDQWLRSLRPQHPEAAVVEPDAYRAAVKALESPFQIEHVAWTNVFMFVPETRFNCRECRLPVRLGATECPFCKTSVAPKVAKNPDPDGDGMPTEWEEEYGLDPFDDSDAPKDNDNDGYTNLDEFKEETDPANPESHPAAIERLTLKSITGKKFGLRFNSRIKTGKGLKFGLNYRLPSGETKTDFVTVGEQVARFTVKAYTPKEVKVLKPFPRTEDRSELTLVTEDGEAIVLVKGQAKLHVELTAHLQLTLPDGAGAEYAVKKDDVFKLDEAAYQVIAIDAEERRVILQDERSQNKIVVQGAVAPAL